MSTAPNIQEDMPHIEPPEIDLDSYKDMSVGQILRRMREHYGQSLEEVEANLHIRASQLNALEELNLEALPGRVYAIGFVRSYSEYLGLDGDKMVHLFKAQSVGKVTKIETHFPISAVESQGPGAYLIFGALIALILFIAYWSFTYTPTHHVEEIPPLPEKLRQGNAALLAPIADEEVKVEAMERDVVPMELRVVADSWVEIKNAEGKVVLQQVLKTGDKYIVPQEEGGLTLTTGNAGGIEVYIDGEKAKPLGKKAEVKRNVALDIMRFR